MSELNERRWAVMSERGCEASELTYDEAQEHVRRLINEKVYGLSIITNEAARYLPRRENKADAPKDEAKAPLSHTEA